VSLRKREKSRPVKKPKRQAGKIGRMKGVLK